MLRFVRAPALIVVGIMLLQAAWILTVPPFRGSDEFDHAYRAAAVARGEWVAGDPAGDDAGWLVEVPKSLVVAANAQCEELPGASAANCSPVEHTSDGNVLVGSTAASYHPAFYWIVGTAALPFEGAGALYAMRIATALLCLLLVSAAAWALGRLPGRWPLVALVLAATPVLVYSTSIVAPNGLEIAAALSLWSSLLAFCHVDDRSQERRLLWVAIVSAIVMGTLRLIGPLFILLIVATIALLRGRQFVDGVKRHLPTFVGGSVLIGLSVAQFVWWTFGPPVLDSSKDSPDGPDHFLVGNLVLWPLQSIAAFPYRDQMGAAIVYPVVGALVLGLLLLAVRMASRRERWVVLLSLAAALCIPILLTLATMQGRGVIWQGRYGLPYAVGFVLIAGCVIAQKASGTVAWRIAIPAGGLIGAAVAACLVKVRNNELADNLASRTDPAWHTPSSITLLLLATAAVSCFAIAVSRSMHDRA